MNFCQFFFLICDQTCRRNTLKFNESPLECLFYFKVQYARDTFPNNITVVLYGLYCSQKMLCGKIHMPDATFISNFFVSILPNVDISIMKNCCAVLWLIDFFIFILLSGERAEALYIQ